MNIDSISYDIGNNAETNAQIALANSKPYKAGNAYDAGDWCTNDGKIYSANVSYVSGTTGFDTTKWSLIGETNNVLFVTALPTLVISTTVIYVLTTNNYSLNIYDGTAWHTPTGSGTVQIQADWNEADNTKLDYIKNKPTITGVNTGDETQATIKTKLGVASNTVDGYLTSIDWGKFNSKQNSIYLQTTQPATPINKDIWINNTSTPYSISIYNGTIFVPAGGTESATISAWIANTSYLVGGLVIEANNLYQCITANNDAIFTVSKWNLISSGIGTVTNVSSANADILITTGTTTPVATLNSGTGANQIVKLNATAQLPAVSGVNLTGLTATNITNGILPSAQLPTTVTTQGNTFNGVSELVQTGSDGKLPILDGSKLTNVTATAVMTNATTTATGAVELANDLAGTAILPVVTGINGIHVNDTTRSSTTPFMWWNSTSHNYEHTGINVGNIVNSSGTIVQPAGSPILISQNQEVAVNHTAVTNDRIIVQVLEQIPGITSSDMSTNFNTASDYIQQDSTKTVIGSGSVSLSSGGIDSYTKLMLNMNGTNGSTVFTDSEIVPKTATATGAVISTTQTRFGGSSGYFNGSSKVSIPSSSDLEFGTGNFTIDFDIYISSFPSVLSIIYSKRNGDAAVGFSICLSPTGNIVIYATSDGSTWNIFSNIVFTSALSLNSWHHIAIIRNGNYFYGFLDGTVTYTSSAITLGFASNSYPANIGSSGNGGYFTGYLHGFRVSNGIARWISAFTPPNADYYAYPIISSYISDKLTSFSLSNISSINSLIMTQTTPTNTYVKWLVSFDGRKKWLYHDGTGWHIAIDTTSGNLSDSGAFTNSNIYTDVHTYFTNLIMTQLTTDLSSLGISPIQLDFAWLLGTTDGLNTPSLAYITIGYTTAVRNEVATSGKYLGLNNDYGIRRISSTQTNIRKKSIGDNVYIIPNMIIGS